ncbi:hypothetical protein [Bacillus sp. Marseille-P3800]|uniref:hypothetical protein n=1 Tax=Bacillus sp. Marseille-P3800 TaxID=2014782 RepID=UPI000C078167|nr:hypothetical protein [Bacillus sp. Marseille-P3800]
MSILNLGGYEIDEQEINELLESIYDQVLYDRKYHGAGLQYNYIDSDSAYCVHIGSQPLYEHLTEKQAQCIYKYSTNHLYTLMDDRGDAMTSTQNNILGRLEEVFDMLSYEAEQDEYFNEFLAKVNSNYRLFPYSMDDFANIIKTIRQNKGL